MLKPDNFPSILISEISAFPKSNFLVEKYKFKIISYKYWVNTLFKILITFKFEIVTKMYETKLQIVQGSQIVQMFILEKVPRCKVC